MKTLKYAEDLLNQEKLRKVKATKSNLNIRIMGKSNLIESFEDILKGRESCDECEIKSLSKELNIKTSDIFKRKLGTIVIDTEKIDANTDMEE